MKILAQRSKNGVVTAGNATATIPTNYSMVGMFGTNGIIDGGEYKNDGLVYINNKPAKKWHVSHDGIRLWEPKLNDLPSLYKLYKKTQKANNLEWNNVREVLIKLWSNHKQGDVVRAHVSPTHNFTWNKPSTPWWEYNITDNGDGLGFSFHWLDEKPKRLINYQLGQELYNMERRWYDTTSHRVFKVKCIFYEAMKKSLPTATENKVISLQFGDDTYWFHTNSNGSNYHWWEMFKDSYSFEIKKIL